MSQPLPYRITPKLLSDGSCRHLIVRQDDCLPSLVRSLFEAHLAYASHNSKAAALCSTPGTRALE